MRDSNILELISPQDLLVVSFDYIIKNSIKIELLSSFTVSRNISDLDVKTINLNSFF